MDLYLPESPEGRRPLVVWLHGGAWRSGSKDDCPAAMLTSRGYVVASVEYRLSSAAIFPAQIHDCKAAIRWLRAHADNYGIDVDRVGVWGPSSGGHLAALLGTSGGVASLEGNLGEHRDQSSRVQAVCDFCGPTDFLRMDAQASPKSAFRHDGPDSPESQLIGGPIRDNPDKVAAANPITYVSKDDPPFLIVHGDRDDLVPMHQSQLLNDALKAAGVDVQLHVLKDTGHFFGGSQSSRWVAEFFDRHLKPQAVRPQ